MADGVGAIPILSACRFQAWHFLPDTRLMG